MPLGDKDNLLSMLFTWSPRENRKPLENYCSQALVWCLKNSKAFREAFFERCGLQSFLQWEEALEIHAQYPIKTSTGIGYLDVLIEAGNCETCCAVIECKVEDALGEEQLTAYDSWLQSQPAPPQHRHLLSLTKRTVPPNCYATGCTHFYWRDVCRLLSSSDEPDGSVKFLLQQFAGFQKDNGMAGYELSPVRSDQIPAFQNAQVFWQQVKTFLTQFRNLHREQPLFGELLKPEETVNDSYWLGLYSKTRHFYLGFGMPLKGNPQLFTWIEFSLSEKDDDLFHRLPPHLQQENRSAEEFREWEAGGKKMNREDNRFFAFKRALFTAPSEDAEALANYFLTTVKDFTDRAGNKFLMS